MIVSHYCNANSNIVMILLTNEFDRIFLNSSKKKSKNPRMVNEYYDNWENIARLSDIGTGTRKPKWNM